MGPRWTVADMVTTTAGCTGPPATSPGLATLRNDLSCSDPDCRSRWPAWGVLGWGLRPRGRGRSAGVGHGARPTRAVHPLRCARSAATRPATSAAPHLPAVPRLIVVRNGDSPRRRWGDPFAGRQARLFVTVRLKASPETENPCHRRCGSAEIDGDQVGTGGCCRGGRDVGWAQRAQKFGAKGTNGSR